MDTSFALAGSAIIILIVIGVIFLPQIITTVIMSSKGYSGCLWFFLSLFLSWIGVIIAICMPNIKRQEEQHREILAAVSSKTLIVNNLGKIDTTDNSEKLPNISGKAINDLYKTRQTNDNEVSNHKSLPNPSGKTINDLYKKG